MGLRGGFGYLTDLGWDDGPGRKQVALVQEFSLIGLFQVQPRRFIRHKVQTSFQDETVSN
jgi:hypothetical protein